MKRFFVTLVFCMLLPSVCNAAGAKPNTDAGVLLKKAEALVDRAEMARRSRVSAVPLYDEPLALLTQITSRYPQATAVNAQAEKLKALCYGRQARYSEEHKALKRRADLVCGGDKDAAAELMKAEAEAVAEAGEMTEAVLLYRTVAREYPGTQSGPEALFAIGKSIAEEKLKVGSTTACPSECQAAVEYKAVIQRYPESRYAADACIALAEMCPQRDKATTMLEGFLQRNPRNQYTEAVFDKLCQLLNRREDRDRRMSIMLSYLDRYPQGKYSALYRSRLEALRKVEQTKTSGG